VDAEARRLVLADGAVPYDTLVVAAGSQTSYFGHNNWEACAPGVKSIEDATRVRHKILYAFEAAERESDPSARRAWLTFVIVGAGPTGVEVAGALAEIANDTLRNDFRSIHPEESQILLLEGAPRVLPTYPEDLSGAAERSLIKLGVRPRTGVRVTSIDDTGVAIGSERIQARTVIWAAGVSIAEFIEAVAKATGAERDRRGRRSRRIEIRAAGWSRSGRHAGGPLRRACDSRAAARAYPRAVPLFQQGNAGGDRAEGGSGRFRKVSFLRSHRVAAVAVRPLDVPGGVPQSPAGVYPLGVPVSDLRSGRAPDYRK
jgi:NADPH-dependent 2,4-dienoyl-CoA reductase/sulfur reductase-like enzyme